MDPEEVGNMVARLQGDGSSYMQMLQQATQASQRTATEVLQFGQQIQGFQGSIQGFANAVLNVLQRIGAESKLRELFHLFEQHEEIHIKLRTAVAAHGGAVRATMKDYEEFAKQISATTTLAKDSVLSLIKRAEAFGLTGDKAKSAVQSAIALGEASDTSAEAMIRMTAQFEQGDLKRAMAFARMVPQLRGVRDQTEFVAKYQALVNVGMKQTEELAKTAGGQLKQLSNAWVGFKKELGATVAESIKPFIGYFKNLIGLFKTLSPETKKMIVYVLGVVAAIISLTTTIALLVAVFGPLVSTILPILITGFGLLLSPLGLVTAALAIGAGLWLYYSGAGGKAIHWLQERFGEFVEYIKPAIKGVTDALKAGNLELAVKIIWAQIELTFAEGSFEIRRIWSEAIAAISLGMSDLWTAAEKGTSGVLEYINKWYAEYLKKNNKITEDMYQFMIGAAEAQTAAMNAKADADAAARKDIIMGDLKKEIEGFKKNIENLKKERDNLVAEAGEAAAKVPPIQPMKLPDIKIPKIPPIPIKGHVTLDFAEFGSAEAQARLREQADKFGVVINRKGEAQGKDPNTGLLRDIRDLMKVVAGKEGLPIEPADMDDFE